MNTGIDFDREINLPEFGKLLLNILNEGTSAGSTKQAPVNLLANRGNLDSAVLRNSWFRQLFVRDTEKRGVDEGPFVDIFDELQARATIT